MTPQEPERKRRAIGLVELMQGALLAKRVADNIYCLYFKRYTLCVPFVFSVVRFLALVELRHRRIVDCLRLTKSQARHSPCFGRFHSAKTIQSCFRLRYHNSQRADIKKQDFGLAFLLSLCVPFVFTAIPLTYHQNRGGLTIH